MNIKIAKKYFKTTSRSIFSNVRLRNAYINQCQALLLVGISNLFSTPSLSNALSFINYIFHRVPPHYYRNVHADEQHAN